ncbi:alpha/beta hydrolase [Paractinoplanes abujensis]|uniref:Pimeloyl-ACP methyl ester carboxylesterase n=1 Tax=Paractinoplanes abujensis TaxID=882441 RepID=A0A7W7CNF7_9ACTN|nr:alpha/beta hydrolase [Actinoplanes abujensis]MBB4691783.1 pimeloyl-ACP methyl ester carboxylesterase [Actinoplanes abujensis]GID16794.1 alpha/beta hydrolase [Actinoplanes abujensis]
MTLSHDSHGSGPTILLLHSTVCDRRMWDPLTFPGRRVVRVDLPGYGDSPVASSPADVAAQVLEPAGDGPVALVGSSGGGMVALEIAARWPGRVTSLALLCTAAPALQPTARLRAVWDEENALLQAGDVEGATALNVRTWVGPRASGAVRDLVFEMQRHAFEVQLAAGDAEELETDWSLDTITAPALLVSGAYDLPEFRTVAADLAGRLPGARHVELEWAGHLPSLEDPPVVNELLLDFLRA